jgi:hypothetical protein
MTGRVAEVTAVSALALLLTLAIAAPVLRAPSDRIFGRETVGRHHDPFTVMEQFGRPLALGVYLQPLTDVPGAWLARMLGPVAAYNWLVLLTFPLSAAAAYLLARHLMLSPAAAGIAAIAFAFSPFHLAHAGYHPHIAQTQWVALYFLALWRCLDDSTAAAVGLLALSAAGVTLSNFYGGLIAAVITPMAIAAYWFVMSRRQPRPARRLAITTGSLALIACAGIAGAWYTAHAAVVNRASFGFERDDLFRFSAKWWSYLVPPVANPWLGGIADRVWGRAGVEAGLLEQQVSLGWGIIALGLVAVVAWLMRDRRQPALTIVPVLVVVAVAALVCSLSPERAIGPFTFTRPAALLYRVVPMFRSYARFGVVVQLMAVLLAGIGAERLWRSRARAPRMACAALLVVAAGEYAVWPPALWRDVLPTAALRWIARQPGTVRALDCAPLTQESASIQWLTGGRVMLRDGWFDDCTEPDFSSKLSAAGYTHLVVRPGTAEGRWFASQGTPDGLNLAAHFGDGDVFAVTAGAPVVYTAQMTSFHSREYDPAWTWRWMGPDASWTIVNSSRRPVVASVEVEMTAFDERRRVTLLLDGVNVQALPVEPRRATYRLGPFALTPGQHALVFHPVDPPTVADERMKNGDRRRLSVGIGAWHWAVEGERP